MPVFDRFVPMLVRRLPTAYYLSDTVAIALLRLHGVHVERRGANEQYPGLLERFKVDSVVRSPRPFQGHSEMRVTGRWEPVEPQRQTPNEHVVRTNQPLGRLVMYLLDPRSDDGLATWNVFDASLGTRDYPVIRDVTP